MNIQTACPVSWRAKPSRQKCPQCDSLLLIAEESAFDNDHIRHNWLCDGCGQKFTTSIRLLAPQA